MAIMRLVLITIGLILFFYLSHQLTRFADMQIFEMILVIWIVFVAVGSTLAMPLVFWSEQGRKLSHQRPHLMKFSFYSMSYFSALIAFVGARDFFAFFIQFYQVELLDTIYSKQVTYAILSISLIILFWSWRNVQMGARIVKKQLIDERFPKEVGGLRILQISDLHISHFVSREFVQNVVDLSIQQEPDLVFLTGDIVDGHVHNLKQQIELLGQLKSKHGVYYVVGNHEYYSNVQDCIEVIRSLGIRVLLNHFETIEIENKKLMIAGLLDPAARMFQMELPNFDRIKDHIQNHDYKMILIHQPHLANHAAQFGFDLQMSGHTHGGQFFPWNFMIRLAQKYPKGFYKIKNMHLYVNQGTAYWGPAVRFGTQCEITLLSVKHG